MKELIGKVALVTGAASGIGRATALALARDGARLIVCDVDEQGLEDAAAGVGTLGACLLAQRVDVSRRDDMAAFAAQVHDTVPSVDVLVNSAGVYLVGGFLDLSLEDWDWALSVNLWGVIHACHYFVPRMAARGAGGHVVNLASMYGFWPSPGVAGYLTSKFGVFGFSESLREDLRGSGIGVSTVCPGVINTGIVRNMRIRNAAGEAEGLRHELEQAYARRNYGPEKVADAVVQAIRRNRKVVLVSPEAQVMYRLERWCPPLSRLIARAAANRLFRVRRNG